MVSFCLSLLKVTTIFQVLAPSYVHINPTHLLHRCGHHMSSLIRIRILGKTLKSLYFQVLVSFQSYSYQLQFHFNKIIKSSRILYISKKIPHSCSYQQNKQFKSLWCTQLSDEKVCALVHANAEACVSLSKRLAEVWHFYSSFWQCL